MTRSAELVRFPFEPERTYTIGELRSFEQRLSAACQNDRSLRASWRVPTSPDMKRWCKIREETYPIKLLADHKSWSDGVEFRLKPFGFQGIDAEISSANEKFELQITSADPIWDNGGIVQNGGYDYRLALETLNSKGSVNALERLRRSNGEIVSDFPTRSPQEVFAACRQGLIDALTKKLKRSVEGCHLLIHARGYCIHAMDFTFERVARESMEAVKSQTGMTKFAAYYFVDEREFFQQ
jgi:hypothetical protein